MKQNIWTIKNILRIIISILVIATMLKSCSYAYNTNITEFENDIKAKLSILKEKGVIASNFSYNNIGTPYDQYFDYILMLRPQDKQTDGTYNKIFIGYWRRAKHNPIVNASYNNTWGYSDSYVYVKGFNTQTGAITDSLWTPSLRSWTFDYVYTTIEIDTSNMTLGEGEEYGSYYITEAPSTFNFRFYDESITASVPNGETAYCVFLDPITDNQKIGYIENFEEHKNTQIQIFAQNYRNTDNVLVNSIGEMNYYLNESGELFVNTNTMWSALVYEIVGIDNGPSGDFLNGQNFIAYYYIAARNKRKWRCKFLWS